MFSGHWRVAVPILIRGGGEGGRGGGGSGAGGQRTKRWPTKSAEQVSGTRGHSGSDLRARVESFLIKFTDSKSRSISVLLRTLL